MEHLGHQRNITATWRRHGIYHSRLSTKESGGITVTHFVQRDTPFMTGIARRRWGLLFWQAAQKVRGSSRPTKTDDTSDNKQPDHWCSVSAGPWLLMTSDTLRNLKAPRARGHQQPPKPGFCRNEIYQEHSAEATTWFFRNIFGCGNTCSHLDCRAANNQIRSALCSLKVFLITHEPQPV